ncbi:MAG: hypothetical protein ABR613_06235 [Actinomycetota bacterium]
MEDLENDEPRRRGRTWGRAAATVTAVIVFAGGTGVAILSLDEVVTPPGPSSTPAPGTPPPSPPPEEPSEPELVVDAAAPTVYDAIDDVPKCATSRRPYPDPSGAAGFEDDVERISRSVERIRELEFERAIDTRVVPAEEVGRRYAASTARGYSPVQADGDRRWMAVLRLAPEDVDLRTLAVDVARETAAGFYNPRKDRLFSRSSGGVLTPIDEVVLAHELDHALVDQVLRLPGTLSRDPMLSDVMLAHQALIEGDATLVMSRYGAGTLDRATLEGFLRRFSSPQIAAYPGVPWYLQRTSGFPYFEGLLFACDAWRRARWNAIDRMYRRPPASTAEIIFPSRYEERAAGELPRPAGSPGWRWTELTVAQFGAFDLMLMLENADLLATGRVEPGSRVDDVRGWNGGVLNVWTKGAATAIHLSFLDAGVFEGDRRRRDLCGVLRGWVRRTFDSARQVGRSLWELERGFAGLRCAGASVRLAIAPGPRPVRRTLGG